MVYIYIYNMHMLYIYIYIFLYLYSDPKVDRIFFGGRGIYDGIYVGCRPLKKNR